MIGGSDSVQECPHEESRDAFLLFIRRKNDILE
jgi:hypothetical protein